MKIWSGDIEGLNQCTDAKEVSFLSVAEVHIKQHLCTCVYLMHIGGYFRLIDVTSNEYRHACL